MGEATDRLSVKLARTYVPGFKRVVDGKVQDVDGYWREIDKASSDSVVSSGTGGAKMNKTEVLTEQVMKDYPDHSFVKMNLYVRPPYAELISPSGGTVIVDVEPYEADLNSDPLGPDEGFVQPEATVARMKQRVEQGTVTQEMLDAVGWKGRPGYMGTSTFGSSSRRKAQR